ncbi:MAG: hypothetical protein WC666_02985 [Candidatus Paceibacterota bacterium]|jgi:hypothetical protein
MAQPMTTKSIKSLTSLDFKVCELHIKSTGDVYVGLIKSAALEDCKLSLHLATMVRVRFLKTDESEIWLKDNCRLLTNYTLEDFDGCRNTSNGLSNKKCDNGDEKFIIQSNGLDNEKKIMQSGTGDTIVFSNVPSDCDCIEKLIGK